MPGGGIELSPADIEALDARWSSCWTPGQVAQHLAGISAPWCVAAGWALDLFRGTQTREHGDIEIAIPAASFTEVCGRFPELVLLFKAKHARPKDQADFDGTIPRMTPAQRATLAGLLTRAPQDIAGSRI